MVGASVGMAAALGSAASWAVGSILFARLSERLSPLSLTLTKGLISIGLLAFVLAFSEAPPAPPDSLALLILSGVLGIAVGDTLFFAALQRLGASMAVLLFTLGQAMTVGLALLLLGDRPTISQMLGIVVIIASVTSVLWLRREQGKGRTQLTGVLFGLGSIAAMSVSVILAKIGLGGTDPMSATFIRMVPAVIGVALWMLASGNFREKLKPVLDFKFAANLVIAVAVVTFGGFWLSLVAVKNINVSLANALNSTEPIFMLPLAAIWLREKVTRPQFFFAVATVMGVALLSLTP